VINTSSVAHRFSAGSDINDLEVEHGYTQRIAYGNAKLENILFTKELHRRCHDDRDLDGRIHPATWSATSPMTLNSLMRYVVHTPLPQTDPHLPVKAADTSSGSPHDPAVTGNQLSTTTSANRKHGSSLRPQLAVELGKQSAKFCDL